MVNMMHVREVSAVAVMACDDEVVPLLERIETVADEMELEDVQRP